MTRPALGTANRTQATADSVVMVDLVAIAFPGGTLRLASGMQDVLFGGNTFVADGTLGGSGASQETTDLKPRTVTLTLSGANPALIATLRAGNWQYVRVDGWLGFINAADGQLVADPYPIAPDLRASTSNTVLDDGRATISLEIEGRELALQRNSAVLATDNVQQARYPGDTGLSKVVAISELQINWGGQIQRVGTLFDPLGRRLAP